MSLVYFITALPRLRPGHAPPMTREAFVERARQALEGADRAELEMLLLLDEVDESSRIVAEAQSENPNVSAGELTGRLRAARHRSERTRPLDELPEFILEPLPRHVQLRRCYQLFYEEGGPFLKAWSQFAVDLEEVLTGLVSREEGLSEEAFADQMEGRFDSASEIIARRMKEPDLGLGRRFAWMPRVQAALDHHDRLACERELDALRFEVIDDLMGNTTFSLETVLGTYLKLHILEREASFDGEEGQKVLDSMLELPLHLTSQNDPSSSQGAQP